MAAADALRHLACANDRNRDRARELGAIPLLVAQLRRVAGVAHADMGEADVAAVTAATAALRNLSYQNAQNRDAIRAKAIERGVIDPAMVLSDDDIYALIFEPGFSPAATVTTLSGRGVGMDVVRANVERIGGVIALDNHPGQGLCITLRVPLTLTIIPGLVVRAGGLHFAIPRAAVVEILHDNNAMLQISCIGGAQIATIRGVRHSMIELEDVLGMDRPAQAGPRAIMVVRSGSGVPYAMGVAAVDNHEELVIRPASPSPIGLRTPICAPISTPIRSNRFRSPALRENSATSRQSPIRTPTRRISSA